MKKVLKILSCFLIKFKFKNKRRKGLILVSVLMLGTLLISCATAFTWFVRLQVRSVLRERVALSNRSMAELLSEAIIRAIVRYTDRTKGDSPIQPAYKPFVIPINELGIWVLMVTPLDDKLPIRNLFLPDGNTERGELKKPWEDMWDAMRHRELINLVLDFLDRNTRVRVGGAEREDFINRAPLDMSELLIMDEINQDILYGAGGMPGINDYCTLWSAGKINLNVAPPRVLALLPGLGAMQAAALVEYRKDRVLRSFEDIQGIPGFTAKNSTQLTNIAGFKSRYFSLRIEFLDESEGGSSFNIIFDRNSKKIVRWEES
ncbi:MAG: general secretion pathway protein GspK [Synergistaceae bacterium]|nr:general secretion pathway protein GspK [Synergistaceae bacterium]